MTPIQQNLPVSIEVKGRCATLSAARMILGSIADWELNAMIEDGRFAWVINVASKTSSVRELRIPVICITDYQRAVKKDYPVAEMGRYLFGTGQMIPCKTFYEALNMDCSHLYDNLVSEGTLRLAAGSKPRRGPGGSAFLTWLDAINFLTQRRVL